MQIQTLQKVNPMMLLNNKLKVAFVLGALSLTGGCAEVSLLSLAASEVKSSNGTSTTVNRGARKIGKPYQVKKIWYYPAEDLNYNETGIASWYGEPFHGRKTANGAVYDMNQLTAAHKTLPMPTDVRVTNLENGRSIVVTVNDRGPFVHGRIIDLSRRAAQLLGVVRKGTAKVRVEVAQPSNKKGVRFLAKAQTSDKERNMVTAAPKQSVQSASLAPPENAKAAPSPEVTALPTPVEPAPLAQTSSASPSNVVSLEPVGEAEIYIQAGAFVDFDNANKLSAQLSPLGAAKVNQVLVNGQDFYRVRLGPVYNVADADLLLSKLINSGHTEARIIIE
ncbi:MAG: septal ring lytic transglycosylase RlpA family protein [Sneathiella sp.]